MRTAPRAAVAAVRLVAPIWWRIAIICPRVQEPLQESRITVKAALSSYGTGVLLAEDAAPAQAISRVSPP